MKEKELQKVGIKQAVKIGLAAERMTMEELARSIGVGGGTLSGKLSRGTPSLKSTLDITKGLGAQLVLRYANGSEVELVIED